MAASSPRPDLFKNVVIIMLTLISVNAAVVTFLQSYASLRSEDLVQSSEYTAVNATGLHFRAGLEAGQASDVRQRYEDYIQRAVRADTKARALRLGGRAADAADYDLDTERWRAAADEVAQSSPLFTEFNEDIDYYRETLTRDAYLEGERQQTLLLQSRAWNSKANGYVAILSTLSVALFLAGLSLTLGSRVRYFLAASSAGLALICGLWTAITLFTPVPRIPEAAIQRFVDGEIKYNISTARGETGADAIPDFDTALQLAPDYQRAYFYRSLANTDFRLSTAARDTPQAIADGEEALRLGNKTSPVYGNLGWLYYLDGQYRIALNRTETALALAPNECYLHFNRGLTLVALERPSEAEAAYTQAIECARNQTSQSDVNYYLDVGVVDLRDLEVEHPELETSVEPAVRRLKEALVSLRLFGAPEPGETNAQFGDITFGEQVDDTGESRIVDPATRFPQSVTRVYAVLPFSGMKSNSRWVTRWLLDGREYLTTVYPKWEYGKSGSTWITLFNNGGLTSGHYELDVFVEGRLVTSGHLTVLPGPLPPMDSYSSSDLGVTISYPTDWNVTEMVDYDVAVVAARNPDPQHPTFFGVTSYLPTTQTDDDVFELFNLYFDALQQDFSDFSSEQPEAFIVAGQNGWLAYYEYTDKSGARIFGGVAGALDASQSHVYIVMIETLADDWDLQLDLINVMLKRMTIDAEGGS